MKKYNKALIAAAGVALTVANLVAGDNQYVQVVIAVVTALGVHMVPNLEAGVEEVVADVKNAGK